MFNINIEARLLKASGQLVLCFLNGVFKWYVDQSIYIRRKLKITLMHDGDTLPPKLGKEHPHLQDNILTGSRLDFIGSTDPIALIIGRQKYHCIWHVSTSYQCLNDGLSIRSHIPKNNWLYVHPEQQELKLISSLGIVTINNKHLRLFDDNCWDRPSR